MAPLLATAIPFIIESIPNIANLFGGKKAEDAAKDVLNIAKKVTGASTDDEAIEALKADPNVLLEWKKAVLNDKYRLDEMYLEDRKDARDMQKEALKQDDIFSKRFIYYFAAGWSVFSALYLSAITFFTIPEANIRIVDTVTGFLLGSLIAAIIQFFFGSSYGSSEKNKSQEELTSSLKSLIDNKNKEGK